ncbi:MAG: hypothetical protein U0Q18_27965 [Bryobacteraceae bacterium]
MLVLVGGHTRNIGKTSVAAGLIRTVPEGNWSAMKITQFGHGICSASGKACGCCLAPDHLFDVTEEREPNNSDSGRFLEAGARRSYWVRTALGQLGAALPTIHKLFDQSSNFVVESNSLVEFLRPDLYLMVLDFEKEDFKASSLRLLNRADACVVIQNTRSAPTWENVPTDLWQGKPKFQVAPPQYAAATLSAFVADRLTGAATRSSAR